jgi:hypothetical protein
MKREFLIEEIMLDGVSGEIRGTIEFDSQSGLIDHVDCDTFCFRRNDLDSPTLLDQSQRVLAIDLVERLLEGEVDVASGSGQLVASAQAFSPRPAVTPSRRILAEYLESAGRPNADERKRRAQ